MFQQELRYKMKTAMCWFALTSKACGTTNMWIEVAVNKHCTSSIDWQNWLRIAFYDLPQDCQGHYQSERDL